MGNHPALVPADMPYLSSYRPPFDSRPRITELRRMLDENEVQEGQRINLEAAIEAYSKGRLRNMDAINYIQDGKLLGDDITALHGNSPWWSEGRRQQMTQISTMYLPPLIDHNFNGHHEIFMKVKLLPNLGFPNDKILTIGVMNDTGSDSLSIWETDLVELGITTSNARQYMGWGPCVEFMTPNGFMRRHLIRVLVQLVDATDHESALTDWFEEEAVCNKPTSPNQMRISGRYMRQHLYFATSPGNGVLYVANSKQKLFDTMPAYTQVDVRNADGPLFRTSRGL